MGEEYEVPAKVERIVITGSMEAMEDALVLGVKPVGAISVGGQFPEVFAEITGEAESIGEKSQPNFETILKLKPDVILGTAKFPDETKEQLAKITTTFPVSHISTNWENNLRLLGELTGKEAEAEAAIAEYYAEVENAKASFDPSLQEKTVIAVRVRRGSLFIYPENIFLNPILYTDLGLSVPEPVQAAASQENISLEMFSELDPDYIFLQFSEAENTDNPKALEELQNNPIWQSIRAVKEDKVFVNVLDPLAEGGPSWSRMNFLKLAVEKLSK